jgi:two-component system, cell cycle response regulator
VADIAQRTVLLVDDSKFVRATFKRILEANFVVREEADGEAGWITVQADKSIVMVFTDLSMPKLDGFGLLGRIRGSGDPQLKALPVVVISGEENEATKKRARESGANDFIGKTADAPEVLARIDNLLRLVQAKVEVEVSREAVQTGAMRDPITGVFTPQYLLTEGRKHFSHAKRHGGPLSVVILRVDSYAEIEQAVGKDVAGKLLARIAGLLTSTLRTEDSVGRTGENAFTVISASSGPAEALTFARRMRDQLQAAPVKYQSHTLSIRASLGIASLGHDTANSMEDLLKIALQRMQPSSAARPAESTVPIAPAAASGLPAEVERALQVLERLTAERLGPGSDQVVKRMMPFLQSAFRRLQIDLPADKIMEKLQGKK